jgi:hypothetical protein
MDDSDLLTILNAGGESIVDALLYLVSSKGLFLHSLLLSNINIDQASKTKTSNTSRVPKR